MIPWCWNDINILFLDLGENRRERGGGGDLVYGGWKPGLGEQVDGARGGGGHGQTWFVIKGREGL